MELGLWTTGPVQQLRNYLGQPPLQANRLPESLWKWVEQQDAASRRKDNVRLRRTDLVLEREGKRLVIRFVSDLDQKLLLIEEQRLAMESESLVSHGLSPREGQVLEWVSQGKTDKEIGMILELSPRTVQKHLEHIYRKVGVESRTGAAAKAYEIASMVNVINSLAI
jgi:DNA-binding CsgD family transcriptional regulator